ncbi:MAG: hypothetical protein QXZ70_03755 [Candidatus Bathyarchaeia archaeon]
MPKCVNGHLSNNLETCESCGHQINLEVSLEELSEFPEVSVPWKESCVLTLGFPEPLMNDAHIIQIEKGDNIEENESLFRVKIEGGKTWSEIVVENKDRFKKWVRRTGFYCAKRKLVVIDTTDVLSPLLLQELSDAGNMLVVALSADESSNALEQNISYVAMSALKQKRLPTIICPKSYVDEMPFFVEDKELIFRNAFEEVIIFFVSALCDLITMIKVNQRLGVYFHYFYTIFSASDMVYPKPENAISFQLKQIQHVVKQKDIQTAHLLGRAEIGRHENLIKAFKKVFREDKDRLVNMSIRLFEKNSEYGLYDLVLILGVNEIYLSNIERGYQLIASKNPNLRVMG